MGPHDCPTTTLYVASCPTDMLYGCCTDVGGSDSKTTNIEEDCAYVSADSADGGNFIGNEATCAHHGGTWSTTP